MTFSLYVIVQSDRSVVCLQEKRRLTTTMKSRIPIVFNNSL